MSTELEALRSEHSSVISKLQELKQPEADLLEERPQLEEKHDQAIQQLKSEHEQALRGKASRN